MEVKKLLILSIFITAFLMSTSINATDSNNVSLELLSNKQIYLVGENVSLTLKINNSYNQIIPGQIKGKVIIGDIGYEIQCFDYPAPANDTQYLGLTPLIATMSNSNMKTMTTLYVCSGTQMQSTKSISDNSWQQNSSGKESYTIGPFSYSYTYNNTDYEIKSNTLNVTVVNSQNQNQNTQQQSSSDQNAQQQSSQTQNSQSQNTVQNQQNMQSQQQDNSGAQSSQQSMSTQNQQALSNNQQNAQSINQINKDIQNAKTNPLNTQMETEEKKEFWIWLLIIFVTLAIAATLYFKYHKVEEIKYEKVVEKPKIPKYIKFLNTIKNENDNKEKAKLVSQAIRNFIATENNLNQDITNSKALMFTKNKLFIDLLKKTEEIEFAQKKITIDYEKIIKQLKGEMKK